MKLNPFLATILTVLLAALPASVFAEGRELKIIDASVSLDQVKNVNRDTGLVFYINGGETDDLRESMVLDVFRVVEVKDKRSGKRHETRKHVGQLKIVKVSREVSIAKLHPATQPAVNPGIMVGDHVVPVIEPQQSNDKSGSASPPPAVKSKVAPDKPETVPGPLTILFKYHDWQLTEEVKQQLSKLHDQFSKLENYDISIEGHTDNSGSGEYNIRLSEMRAQAIANYFIKTKGVPEARVHYKGFGGEKPAVSNDTEAGREKNRRVAVQFTKNTYKQ